MISNVLQNFLNSVFLNVQAEPLDDVQSHNGYEVSVDATVSMSGFTCPVCSKTLPTLVSLKRHVNWHKNVGNNMEKKLECFVCKEVTTHTTALSTCVW